MNYRTIVRGLIGVLFLGLIAVPPAQAACGATQCFVVIGSQQQIPQKGLLTTNAFYNYTPFSVAEGTTGLIPHANQERQRLTLDNHKEIRTILQTYTLDLNYGLTEKFGVQVTMPYTRIRHKHLDEVGEEGVNGEGRELVFSDNGIGDIRLTGKYNAHQSLTSMVVTGLGVVLPTGDYNARDRNGVLMEPTLQVGRGAVGVVPSVYQTYQIMPNRLSQFAFASYRHTFRNSDGYQFGDEYLLNAGANLVTAPWLVLTGQFNYRYQVHDNMTGSLRRSLNPSDAGFPGGPVTVDSTVLDRRVPNTGQTFLAFSPGFQVNFNDTTSLYFYSQIPVARDFNNNLTQGTSFVFGLTKSFQTQSS